MNTETYRISVVLDPGYGKGLIELSKRNHVWASSSKDNLSAAQGVNTEETEYSLERGITTFKVSNSSTPEERFVHIVNDIDLHHGEHSHGLPWNELEVIGVKPTEEVIAKLNEYGAISIVMTEQGFLAKRELSNKSL